MIRKYTFVALFCPVLAVMISCGATQKLHVESDPGGAEVYLMRRGDYEISASVDGIGGSFDGDSFEDDYYFLGTTPLDYEFDLSDRPVLGEEAASLVLVEFTDYE